MTTGKETVPLHSVCDRALPPTGAAPEWVHLLPVGHIVARDGREFDLTDPGHLVAEFVKGGIDLPIDYEHQNDRPEARLKGPVPAAGWIKELAHNEEGLWGRVEWTATARELIESKEYRFLSPSFFHQKSGQIIRLSGAGLVHRPALHLKALASQDHTMQGQQTATNKPDAGKASPSAQNALIGVLFKHLGLAPDATEEEALEALENWLASAKPDPKKFVPVEAVAEMLRERNVEQAVMSEDHANRLVNSVIEDGWLFPGLRSWALALCKDSPESFKAFVDGTKAGKNPQWGYLRRELLSGPAPQGNAGIAQTEAEASICSMLGLTAEQLSKA